MAATNYTPIQLYYSTTASAVPLAANLAQGELAINIADGKLYYEDSAGVVQVIATKGAGTIGGSTTQIQYNNAGALAGSSAMTFNNSTNVVTLTTLNLTNALGATYGGTAQSSYTQGDLLYSSATNTLSKLGIGTVDYILTSTGSVPQWSAPSSISVLTATNLAGGAAGSVPYQSAASTTTFLAIGAANRVMTSTGSAPQWVTALTGLTGVSSSSITNTSLTSGRLVYSTTGGAQTDDADLTFDGTTLSAGGYSTAGLTTLVKTVKIGDSNFSGVAVFAPATPAKLYIGTGTVTDTTSAIGATNAAGAIASLAITPIAATNTSVTYTNAATLYIAGAPSAGTNVTLTNPYALYVAAGDAYFGGTVTAGTVNLTTLDLTNLEVTNIKAKDGTAAITIADSTGAVTVSSAFSTQGNTTLGDASTDTVQVNGYMGIGGAGNSEEGLRISNSALTGTGQTGLRISAVATSAATSSYRALTTIPFTAAASFTVTNVYGYLVQNTVKGAGSTITNQYGIYINDQTEGTNDYGLYSAVTSGANKWNIYSGGSAQNYFAGNVGIGEPAPTYKLEVTSTGNDVLKLSGGVSATLMQFNASSTDDYAFGTVTSLAGLGIKNLTDDKYNFFISDNGNVSVGTNVPSDYFELYYSDGTTSATGTSGLLITNANAANNTIASLLFRNYDNFGAVIKSIRTGSPAGLLTFGTNSGGGTATSNITEKMRITSDGIVVNNGALDYDFRIASDNNSYAFFVDAGNDQVVVGSSTPVTGSASNIPLVVRYSSGPSVRFYSNQSASQIATVGIGLTTYGDSRYAGYQTVSGGGMWTNSSNGSTTFLTAPSTSGIVRIGNFSQDPFENTSVAYVEYANFNSGEIVFNDESRDIDFRVESDGQSYAFFVDAGNNAVGIGTSSPTTGNAASVRLTMAAGDSSSKIQMNVNGGGATYAATDVVNNPSNGFRMGHINGTDRWELAVGSNDAVLDARATSLTVNQTSLDQDFIVESDTYNNMLFVDAGTNRVGFGTSSPVAVLDTPNLSNSNYPITRFSRDRASRIHVFSTGASTKTVTIDINDFGLTGFLAYVDVSGHNSSNGNDRWYDRYVWALMEESGSTRVNNRLTNYEFTYGTSRVTSPTASFPGGGATRITFTVTAGYDTKVWVKIESAGADQVTSISVA